MVALDSSAASRTAFDYCINAMDRENDRIILVSIALEHLNPFARLAKTIRESDLQKAQIMQPLMSKLKSTPLTVSVLAHHQVSILIALSNSLSSR